MLRPGPGAPPGAMMSEADDTPTTLSMVYVCGCGCILCTLTSHTEAARAPRSCVGSANEPRA